MPQQEADALALAYDVVPAAKVAKVGAYVASLGIDMVRARAGASPRPRQCRIDR